MCVSLQYLVAFFTPALRVSISTSEQASRSPFYLISTTIFQFHTTYNAFRPTSLGKWCEINYEHVNSDSHSNNNNNNNNNNVAITA
jgi:hypothetical protein